MMKMLIAALAGALLLAAPAAMANQWHRGGHGFGGGYGHSFGGGFRGHTFGGYGRYGGYRGGYGGYGGYYYGPGGFEGGVIVEPSCLPWQGQLVYINGIPLCVLQEYDSPE
jgi:hypothetical protein